MFKRTFKDFKNLKKWEHILLCWDCYNNRKHLNYIKKLKLNYLGYSEVYGKFAYRNKFKYSIRKKSRMKKLNFKKLEVYSYSLKSLPLTRYRIDVSKKLFILLGYMIFEFVILTYLFGMILHIILALIIAYLVYAYLFAYNFTFLTTVYILLFKNDKKMMECLDD